MVTKKKSKIRIKPENVGDFKSWARRKGLLNSDGSVGSKAIQAGLKSSSSRVRRMANFARNARKWKKGGKRK